MGAGKTLASDAVEKEVLLTLTRRAILIDASAVSLCTAIEGTTNRATRDEKKTGVAGTGQWVDGALGESPAEQCTVALADSLWNGDVVERSIEKESRRAHTLCGVGCVECGNLVE